MSGRASRIQARGRAGVADLLLENDPEREAGALPAAELRRVPGHDRGVGHPGDEPDARGEEQDQDEAGGDEGDGAASGSNPDASRTRRPGCGRCASPIPTTNVPSASPWGSSVPTAAPAA